MESLSRKELKKINHTLYRYLLQHRPSLLDKYFPLKTKSAGFWTKERCIEEALKYKTPQEWYLNSKSSQSVARQRGWYKQCVLHMDYKDKKDKSFKKMISMMPENVSFEPGQNWDGVNVKYYFIHKTLGRFIGKPNKLMSRTWKNGLSGHNSESFERRNQARRCPVINLDEGTIYPSMKDAGHAVGVSLKAINNAVRKKRYSAGFRWAYYDPNKHAHLVKK